MLLAIEKTLNWKPRKTHEILLSPELAIIKEYKALMDAEKSEPCCCGGGGGGMQSRYRHKGNPAWQFFTC